MNTMKLTFVNVGYGEAMVLECPDPHFSDGVFVMVIDGGSGESEEFADRSTGRLPFVEYLRTFGPSHIDLMVSTHIHEDHICGLLSAAKMAVPSVLWQTLPHDFSAQMRPLDVSLAATVSQNKFLRALNDYQTLCTLVAQNGAAVRTMQAGDTGELCAGLTYQVLAPYPADAAALSADCQGLFTAPDKDSFLQRLTSLDGRMNNYSLMLRLDYRGTRVLLPGDTNYLGYANVDPTQLKADLFKIGHHGQKDGADAALLHMICPKVVVCCASSDRRYNSAHPDTLRMIASCGATIYFSDCPQTSGPDLPPHRALAFTLDAGGGLSAQYIS